MERFLQRYVIAAAAVVLTILLVFGASLMMRGTDPVAQAGNFTQGDKTVSLSGTSAVCRSGDGVGLIFDAIPADSNGQWVVYAVEAVANTATDRLQILGKSSVTGYAITTLAFSGGNTNYVRVNCNAMLGASGASWFVLDDGAGNAAFGEFQGKIGNYGTQFSVLSTASGFAMGSTLGPPYGHRDLSGVTFPVGSRVYLLEHIGSFVIGNGTLTKDNSAGLVAGTKGSPLAAVIKPTGVDSGVTLYAVTVGYK